MSSEKNNNFHFDDRWKGVNPGSCEPKHILFVRIFHCLQSCCWSWHHPLHFPLRRADALIYFPQQNRKWCVLMECREQLSARMRLQLCSLAVISPFWKAFKPNICEHWVFFPCADARQSCEDRNRDASRPQGWLLCDVAENRRVLYMEKWARATRVLCSRMCMELRSKLPRQNISAGISDKNPPGSDVVLLAGQRTRDCSL